MKRFLGIIVLLIMMVVPSSQVIIIAEDVPQDITKLSFDDHLLKVNATGYEGPLTTGPFPVLSTYDQFFIKNIKKQGKAIAIRGLFSLNNVSNELGVYVKYDDGTEESLKFTEVDLESTALTFKDLQLYEGRNIQEIRLTHGASGVAIEVQEVYIENAYGMVLTMADGSVSTKDLTFNGTGINEQGILLMNYDHSVSFSPNKVIPGIRITLSKYVGDLSAAPGGGSFVVNFYVGGWGKSVSFNDLTRDIQTYNVPVPDEMKGQVITSVVIKTYQWEGIRKIDYIPSVQTAMTTSVKVLIDGVEKKFDAYNINNNNYFKLRDIAMVLNGTAKQFQVSYDSINKSIAVTSNQAYTAVGNELSIGAVGNKTATPTNSSIYINGKEVGLTIYNINNNNYFKLRDLGNALNFGVNWNAAASAIEVSTATGYNQ